MLVLLRSIISFVRNYIQERPTQIFSKLCTVHCGRNVNQPSAPTEFEGKGLQLWWDIAVQQKTSYYIKLERILMIFGNSNLFLCHPLGPFPSNMMRCPWILCFDLLPVQYTDLTHQIWWFLVYIFLGWE